MTWRFTRNWEIKINYILLFIVKIIITCLPMKCRRFKKKFAFIGYNQVFITSYGPIKNRLDDCVVKVIYKRLPQASFCIKVKDRQSVVLMIFEPHSLFWFIFISEGGLIGFFSNQQYCISNRNRHTMLFEIFPLKFLSSKYYN